jgi:two-component system NarL family sensor kinase
MNMARTSLNGGEHATIAAKNIFNNQNVIVTFILLNPYSMNKHFLLFCAYLLLTSYAAFAQPGREQKIYAQYKKETKNLKEDTDKVLRYLKYAALIDQPDTAMIIISKAILLSSKLNFQTGFKWSQYLMDNNNYERYIRGAKKLKEDTNKVLFYLKYAGLLEARPKYWDTAGVIGRKATKLSYKLNYRRGIELSIYQQGNHAEAKKDFPAAIRYYREAAEMAESHQLYTDIYQIYNSCLNLYYYEADYPNAMDIAQKGLAVAERLNDKENQAHYCNQIGFIYQKQEKAAESINYFTKYLNLANEIHNRMMIADACNGIADDYLLKKEYTMSLSWFFKALNIYDKIKERADGVDSARFEKTRGVSKHHVVAYTLFKISTVYKQTGNYRQALQYSLQIFDMFDKKKNGSRKVFNDYDLAGYYINTGDIYRLLKDYKQSGLFLYKGLSLARSILHREDIRDVYAALAKTYEGMHKYDSAYMYSKLHIQLKDSIINEESRVKIAGIQARYDTEKKDREMASQKLFRTIFIVATLLLSAILFLLYSRNLLKQKNKYQSQVNKQKTELFNAVVSAQDNERKRIAQDIHDSLGSVLSAAKLNLSGLEDHKTRLTKGQKEKYEIALGLLDDASAELRNISHNLMPATLLKLGLTAALQNLFDKISATGMHISFTAHGIIERLAEGLEISIYRIVLELVNNIVKHAKANEVTVQLIKYPSYINITVEDNGRGFIHMQTATGTKGMGLSSISSRIEYLKGTIDIDSGIGTGTTVIIDIPLEGSTHSMA